MKKLIYTFLFSLLFTGLTSAQDQMQMQLKNASPEKRKELINKLSPEQKKELYRNYRKNAMMEELKIREEDQEAFGKLYSEYQDSQRRIKERFDGNFNPDQLSDAQAQQKLEESFRYGEELIENRREYARRMQKVVKPQQVIKMFRAEGQMRDKMLDRRMELRGASPSQRGVGNAPRNTPSPGGMRGGG